MEPEEKDIQERLAEIKAKEVKAYKRAVLYTAISVIIGLGVLSFSAWQTVKLERRKDQALKQAEEARISAEKAKEQAEEAMRNVDNARGNLAETLKALDETTHALNRVKETLMGSKRDENAAKQVDAAIKSVETIGAGRWVVISGDNTLAEAQHELQRAHNLGYLNVAIYLRQNSYRTIIEFANETEAKAKISDIRARLSADAYLRDLSKWCPSPQQRNGYLQCPS